jgi:hypothetical protein
LFGAALGRNAQKWNFGEQVSKNQGRNGLAAISGGGTKRIKRLKDPSESGYLESELSEKEILQGVRGILESIEVHHREWTEAG